MLEIEFISDCIAHNESVTVIMMNGYQFRCRIVGEDGECIIVESDGKQSLIFKNAISTITRR